MHIHNGFLTISLNSVPETELTLKTESEHYCGLGIIYQETKISNGCQIHAKTIFLDVPCISRKKPFHAMGVKTASGYGNKANFDFKA